MTFDEFEKSLAGPQPPAHEAAQQDEGPEGSWVHAYLHRKEGDHANAGYWYRRAGRSPSRQSLDEEWHGIVEELLR